MRVDATGTLLQIVDAKNNILASQPLADVALVSITGQANTNNTLTVNYSNGFFTVPISFTGGGGAGSDVLKVVGTSSINAQYTPSTTTAGSGTVCADIGRAERHHHL